MSADRVEPQRVAPWTFRLEGGKLTLAQPRTGDGVLPYFPHGAMVVQGPFLVIEIVFSADHAFRFRRTSHMNRMGPVGQYVWERPGETDGDSPSGFTVFLPLNAEIELVQEYDRASRLVLRWTGTDLEHDYTPLRTPTPDPA